MRKCQRFESRESEPVYINTEKRVEEVYYNVNQNTGGRGKSMDQDRMVHT